LLVDYTDLKRTYKKDTAELYKLVIDPEKYNAVLFAKKLHEIHKRNVLKG